MKKIERLLIIVLALKNRGKMTAGELAELIEVNIRTIYRDIDAISQMDIPIISIPGTDGGYEIMDNYFLPAVNFTKDEILALLISKKIINTAGVPGFQSYIESSFLKIENMLNVKERELNSKIIDKIEFSIVGKSTEVSDKRYFENIKKSFLSKRTLYINYFSPKKLASEEREVVPYVLKYHDGCWYLIGLCKNRDAERTFRLDRILNMKLTENSYTIPKDFDYSVYNFVDSFKKDFEDKSGVDIVLKLSKALYERDKKNLLFKYRDVKEHPDHFIIKINTNYSQDYLAYASKFADAELLSPPELREELKRNLESILEKYR